MPFPDARAAETAQAMQDPQVGDRFSEMYSFWVYVVDRTGDTVVTMEGSPPCEFPNENVKVQTVEELRTRFAYGGTMEGYYVKLAGRGHDVAGWYQKEAYEQ